jgi:carboxypeptidase family protein
MRRFGAFIVVFLLALGSGPASAQETTGTLAGRVIDPVDLPLRGAVITVKGPQGSKIAKTDTHGRFSVPFLTPGTYTIRATHVGFKAFEQQGIVVNLGQTHTITVAMQIGDVSEVVTVSTDTLGVNLKTSTTGAVIDTALVGLLPVGRRVGDVAYMAPGVASSGSAGRANPSMSGGSGLDNVYTIDGVNVTNQGYGAYGSYSVIFGSLGNATPFDFVKEVQVKTGGYEAEFGQSTGGVVNVITKSGGNEIKGSFFGYARPAGLEAAWKRFQSVNGTVQTLSTQQSDVGTEVGGPAWKDRVFFFGAGDMQWDRRLLQAPDGFPLRTRGAIPRSRAHAAYATKVTMHLDGRQRVDASFFGDPSNGSAGPQRIAALTVNDESSFSRLSFGGHNQTIRYDAVVKPWWLVELVFARALNHIGERPHVDTWSVTDQTVSPNVVTGGIGFYESGNRSLNRQWIVKSTNEIGRHAVRYGFEHNNVDYEQFNQITGPSFVAANGRRTIGGAQITILPDTTFGRIFRVDRALFSGSRRTSQSYDSVFIQDVWLLTDRLTVSPGLRYEQEIMSGSQEVLDEAPGNIQGFGLKGNWAPRIGVTYNPGGRIASKIFAHYGRFYARVPNDLAVRSLSIEESITRGDYFDAALTRPIPNGVVTATPDGAAVTAHFITASSGTEQIDLNAKLAFTTEFVVGMERELWPRVVVGVHYVTRSIGRVLEDVATVPVVAYDLGIAGVSGVEYILTNPTRNTPIFPGARFLGASFDDPKHRYHAVDITIRRTASDWSVMASYQWSRLRGNYEGFYRDDNGQSDPANTSLFDFPTNDPSYTSIGVAQYGYGGDIRFLGQSGILPLDRPHQAKLFGTYSRWKNLTFGIGINLTSGRPLTPLAAHPLYSNGGEIPEAARGSGIDTVDGFKKRTPFESQVDFQASYDIRVGQRSRLTLLGEVFNLFNERRPVDYNAWTQLQFGVPNPDYGKPISQITSGPQFQAPFTLRLGARLVF